MNNIIPIAITWGLMSVIYAAIYGDPLHPIALFGYAGAVIGSVGCTLHRKWKQKRNAQLDR